MKVTITDIASDIELGNNGIILEIRDNSDKHLGKLRIGRATVEWCKGKVSIGNGQKVNLEKILSAIESNSL